VPNWENLGKSLEKKNKKKYYFILNRGDTK
jgi:hypothetical protein